MRIMTIGAQPINKQRRNLSGVLEYVISSLNIFALVVLPVTPEVAINSIVLNGILLHFRASLLLL